MITHASHKHHCEYSVEKKKSKARCKEETAGTQVRGDGGPYISVALLPGPWTQDWTRVSMNHYISPFAFPDEEKSL